MPRSRTIRRPTRSNKKSKGFLPEPVQAFIARRIVDLTAAIFGIFGLFGILAIGSYSQTDPSWNTAGPIENPPQNWMGESGAWLADLLVQPFGVAAFLIAIGTLIWSFRLLKRHNTNPFSLRIAALCIATFFGAIACAQIPASWTPHGYAGGAIGTMTFNSLSGMTIAAPAIMHWMIIPLSTMIALASFAFAAAITKAEIAYALACGKKMLINISIAALNASIAFRNWIHHYNNPDYESQPLFKFDLSLPKAQIEPDFKAAPRTVQKAKKQDPAFSSITPAEPSAAPASQQSIPVVKPKQRVTDAKAGQVSFNLEGGDWQLPSLDLLEKAPLAAEQGQLDENALRKNAQLLQSVLADFKIEGEIVSIHPGPVVTLYELEPAPGTKSSRVISLADDIARSMAAVSVRCAVVPGRNVIGIEIPNNTRQFVFMQELLATSMFEKSKQHLPLVLGKDIGGAPVMADLAKMPHLLVAGTTGSGKSVAVNTMILSLLYRLPPEKCRMIMIDPKMLELSVYDDIPHLLSPVVTEPGKAIVALKWAVAEMENRYRSMSKLGVRNIEGYNDRMREATRKGETIMQRMHTGFDANGAPTYEQQAMDLTEIPYIVVIVDEFADLMLVAGKDVENAIQRLAQMARAAGIHLIMATQRPSVDVITGVIKANFPTRISFQVTSKIDSRTILGEGGAEQLLGMGDMLYMAPGGRITRVHGPFVSDEDVEKVVNMLKAQAKPSYLDEVTDEGGSFGGSEVMNAMFGENGGSGGNDVDELYDQAVAIVAREGKASTSFIQRHLQIGYNRAARIIEEMERQGVVSHATATGKRNVLVGDYSDVG
jgi:S-DNA-T family DNA segregation ATPase FtsK/SpoIIIE